jgi:transposase InsO family protein/transposase-like protein
MRYSQAEKMEINRTVEESELSVKRTLDELDVNRSSFYKWYQRYCHDGYDGLAVRKPYSRRFWNKIPEGEKKQIVLVALEHPEKSPRELSYLIIDTKGYFISESSVYRILKSYDLITSPHYIVMTASDKFSHPTTRVNELWQTDFTYFKIVGWGWYYLGSILDDYSRYIVAWKLYTTMAATDVKDLLEAAVRKTGIERIAVRHRPRLLSDNGPCYVSEELKQYLQTKGMAQTHGAAYHPETQGKIERYHRSMKNQINLLKYYLPWELEQEIRRFVDYYNNERYHESLDNVTPADVYYGRREQILTRREKIKERTLRDRKQYNLSQTISQKPSLRKYHVLST